MFSDGWLMKRVAVMMWRSVLLIVLSVVPCIGAHAVTHFLHVGDKRVVALPRLITDISNSDLVFIGETHDDAAHHETELDIIRALHARGIPVAVGLEMFASDSQRQLDDWIAGKLDERSFMPTWSGNWSYDWRLYRDIFLFARDNHIPLIGLNVPKPLVFKVAARGAAGLGEADARELPPRISWELNPLQTAYLKRVFSHVFGNNPEDKSFANFCQAQALRNNGMAWNISKFLNKNPSAKVVVIAGTWHAVKNGVPEQVARYGSRTSVVILPELPEFNAGNATPRETDYLFMR